MLGYSLTKSYFHASPSYSSLNIIAPVVVFSIHVISSWLIASGFGICSDNLSNKYNDVFYVGCTDNLVRRIWEHKNGRYKGFSYRYNTNKLVYYEFLDSGDKMMKREKRLKDWKRDWKIELIEKNNPSWADLSNSLVEIF